MQAAVTALVGPLSARQPAALFLRQLHAVEALEDSLRAKWLTDSSLGHGQDGSMPLEAPGGESLQEPIGSGTELLRTGARGMGEPRPKLGARTGPTSDGSYGSTLSAVAGATVAPSGAASVRHEDPLTDGQCAADPAAAPGVGGAVAGPGLGPLLEVSAEQLLAWCSAAVDDLVDTEFRTPPATPKSTGNARHSPLVRSCAA